MASSNVRLTPISAAEAQDELLDGEVAGVGGLLERVAAERQLKVELQNERDLLPRLERKRAAIAALQIG